MPMQTLRVFALALGLVACSDGGSTAPLTAVSIDQAIATARSQVVDALAQNRFVLAIAHPNLLPAGTIVTTINRTEPSLPEDPDEQNRLELTVSSASWFVLIDPTPTAKLAHQLIWMLVDANTGTSTMMPAFYPPRIGGVDYYRTFAERAGAAGRFEPADAAAALKPAQLDDVVFEGPLPLRSAWQPLRALAGETPEGNAATERKVAVTIASGADREIKNDASTMAALLTSVGFTVTQVDSASATQLQAQQAITTAAAGLGLCDKFFLYVSSHTQLVDDDYDDIPDGGRANRLDYALGEPNATTWSFFMHDRSGIPATIQAIPAGHVNVMLDACFAESLISHMQNPLRGAPFQAGPGQTVKIYASSSLTKTSEGASTLETLGDTLGLTTSSSTYTEGVVGAVSVLRDNGLLDANSNRMFEIAEIENGFDAGHLTQSGIAQMPPAVAVFRGAAVDVVRLDAPVGPFPAGAKIELSRIVGGHVGEPEGGCPDRHLHSATGISIDGTGSYPDPNPTGCGFGAVLTLNGP